jgi:hypothetical protein
MTRAERAAEQVRKAKEKAAALERLLKVRLAEQHLETRQKEARLREETRKLTNKWRFHVGSLADEAGLRAWAPKDLALVFQVLATLGDVSQALAVLEGGAVSGARSFSRLPSGVA